MQNNHIYPKEIRKFEKGVIHFVTESGKNKRGSDIESHILAYFFCHKTLTQTQIQELSSLFREKKISRGSISSFLKQYQQYGVINKDEQEQPYKYSLKGIDLQSLISTSLEAGLKELNNYIKFVKARYNALKYIESKNNEIQIYSILMERLGELSDFLVYHRNLMKDFFSGKENNHEEIKITISNEEISQLKQESIKEIEDDIVNFIEDNPLFILEEIKYMPLLSYLITRKRLTQKDLQKLTGLSSGLISEGLNYLLEKGYIEMEKIKGIRKRFYKMPSIGYTNYLKQLKRFEKIHELKTNLEVLFQQMNERKSELSHLEGYDKIYNWIKQTLEMSSTVEHGIELFKNAISHFKKVKNNIKKIRKI